MRAAVVVTAHFDVGKISVLLFSAVVMENAVAVDETSKSVMTDEHEQKYTQRI